MPYSYPNDVPSYVRGLPIDAQKIFIEAFNSVYEKSQDDNQARAAGWAAVRHGYIQQDNGEWMPMREMAEGLVRYASGGLALNDDGVTSRVQVMRTGTFYHPEYGKFTITDEDLSVIIKNFHEFRPLPPTEMVVDYDHLSTKNQTPQAGKAAGWVKDLIHEDSKLFALVGWTTEAAQAIKDRAFRFISPQFSKKYLHKETNKDIGPTLLSVALTNRPFLEGMEPVILSKEVQAMSFMDIGLGREGSGNWGHGGSPGEMGATFSAAVQGAGSSDEVKSKEGIVDEKLLRELLGLNPEDDIATAIKSLNDKAREEGETVTSLQAQVAQFAREKEAGDKQLREQQAGVIASQALADRKILPKQLNWAQGYALSDPVGFAAFVASAPVVGPEKGERGGDEGTPDSIELTDSERKVAEGMAKAMGVPLDKYLVSLKESKKNKEGGNK